MLICLLIYHCLTCHEGSRCFLYLDGSNVVHSAAEGSPVKPVQMGHGGGNMVPLSRAWDSRPGWMAEFTAINPWLPNYLIHHMHSRLLCSRGDANKHSHMHTSHPLSLIRPPHRYGKRQWGKMSVKWLYDNAKPSTSPWDAWMFSLFPSKYTFSYLPLSWLAFVSEMSSGLCR